MARRWKSLGLLALSPLASACGEPKEAQDPADLLFEDMEYRRPFDDAARAQPAPPAPDLRPATREQCRAAHRRIEELGVELALAEEPDPSRRRRKRQDLLAAPEVRERVTRNTDDCLAQGVSAREAECIASVHSEAEIDGCLR